MGWRRMKGLIKAVNQCSKCHGEFPDEDYDLGEDLCLWCLYPEAAKGKPVELNEMGQNETKTRQMLDNLDYIPEKQSESAMKAYSDYQRRAYLRPK